MRILEGWLIVISLLAGATTGYADPAVVDCSKKSLADAVREASENSTITFTGICNGPVVVTIDGLTLKGVGTAIIDGAGADALTLTGTSRVALMDFEVTNGINGIAIRDGSHVTLTGVNSHDNAHVGVGIQTASSATLTNVSVTGNGSAGVSVDDGVSVIIKSSTFTGNVIHDLGLTFGSRVSIQNLVVGTYSCDSTVLVRGGGITCPH
jgi:hypothetical protein